MDESMEKTGTHPKIKAKIHEETVDSNMKTSIKTEKHPSKPVEKHPESTQF